MEIYTDRKVDYRPNDERNVFQAKTTMLQVMNFNFDFGWIMKWTDFFLQSFTHHGSGSREVQDTLEHEKEDQDVCQSCNMFVGILSVLEIQCGS